jgi:hypothetical protein
MLTDYTNTFPDQYCTVSDIRWVYVTLYSTYILHTVGTDTVRSKGDNFTTIYKDFELDRLFIRKTGSQQDCESRSGH